MTSGCFCRQGNKIRRTPGAESLHPVFLSLPLRNPVSPLYFQKGNRSVRILMSIGGNAGTAGMHWKEPISPKSNPSLLQAADICLVAQALPQILSDLLILPFHVYSSLDFPILASSPHLFLSQIKLHCVHESPFCSETYPIGYSVPCPGTSCT